MARSQATIRGARLGLSGRLRLRRRHLILMRLLLSLGKLITTTRFQHRRNWRLPLHDSPAVDGQANIATERMEHAVHTELLHHFADAQQQKNAASLGMWLFLVTEIIFFGGMFCAYLVYRLEHFNAFAAGSQQLNIWLGGVNTAVLIVSSVTVVLAVKAAEAGKRKLLVGYMVVTVLLGMT